MTKTQKSHDVFLTEFLKRGQEKGQHLPNSTPNGTTNKNIGSNQTYCTKTRYRGRINHLEPTGHETVRIQQIQSVKREWEQGIVKRQLGARSYEVEADRGRTYRRGRRSLRRSSRSREKQQPHHPDHPAANTLPSLKEPYFRVLLNKPKKSCINRFCFLIEREMLRDLNAHEE